MTLQEVGGTERRVLSHLNCFCFLCSSSPATASQPVPANQPACRSLPQPALAGQRQPATANHSQLLTANNPTSHRQPTTVAAANHSQYTQPQPTSQPATAGQPQLATASHSRIGSLSQSGNQPASQPANHSLPAITCLPVYSDGPPEGCVSSYGLARMPMCMSFQWLQRWQACVQ